MLVAATLVNASDNPWTKGDENCRPEMFKQFGNILNTPDGLAIDKLGNVYLSAVNGVDSSYPGHIWKMDTERKQWSVFTVCKAHPKTRCSFPMGLTFDPDGNLYYADAQYFANPDYQSRIMRVVIKNGEPQRIEIVVENVKLPNALRWRNGAIYFTESFFDVPGKYLSGIYRIPDSDLNPEKPAHPLNKEFAHQDPYCIGICETRLIDRGKANGKPGMKPTDVALHIYTAGCDGMDFDRQGNIYTGNFGDGRLWFLKALPDGRYERPKLLSDGITCCDGVCYDPERNWLIITAPEENAVRYWDIGENKLGLIWANGDTDGADGLLDQPCEVLILNKDCILVVNIDAPSPFMVNNQPDAIHHLSIINLKSKESSKMHVTNCFTITSRTPLADTTVYPEGTVKITYQSAFDGQTDWALYRPGDKAKQTIVYLHGSFSTADQIFIRQDLRQFWLNKILRENYPLLSINMRGTSYMSPAATADLTDLLNDCRKQYGSKSYILLGGSGGASSAMAYACIAPEQVSGVIAMGMCDIFARLDFARKSNIPVLKKLAETTFAAYGGTLEEMPELYRARSVLANVKKLNMPIVLTMGEKDKLIPVTETRKVAEALKNKPDFKYYEIPGGDHDSAVWVDIDLETIEIKGFSPEKRFNASSGSSQTK